MTQLSHYDTLLRMPSIDIDCILFICNISNENLGLILRSADIFNVKKVYYHQGQNTLNSKQLTKVSRNSRIPFQFSDGIEQLIDLQKEGYQLVALEITDESVPLRCVSFEKKTCFIIGNEQNGVPSDILNIVDYSGHIEMLGKHISSLNVAIATSIALYEATRFFLHKSK